MLTEADAGGTWGLMTAREEARDAKGREEDGGFVRGHPCDPWLALHSHF